MISKKHVKSFVREGELGKIENYDKAIADKTQIWECHHRLELTLDGEFAHTREELKRMGMYYNRPYFELIFLTKAEHMRLHGKARSEEHKNSISKIHKGKLVSEETRKKMSKPKSNSEFGKKYFEHYGYSQAENSKQYKRELYWYSSHNRQCSWEKEE